ncbi:MAG: lytic transglycosylase domain-containing protein [Acidobacteriota bacterium]
MSSSIARSLVFLACTFATAASLHAELVVLTGGDVIKVKSFEADGEQAHLEFKDGGMMTISMLRVEHVVDDEIEDKPEPLPAAPAVVAFPLSFDAGQEVPATRYGDFIYSIARENALNPKLVAAVVKAESAFNARAYSSKGACGLMQLMPATGRRFGVAWDDLFDARKNLAAGTKYLKWLVDRFQGDLPKVLAAYNAGEGSVDRYAGVPPYRETREYIRRVYAHLGLTPTPS